MNTDLENDPLVLLYDLARLMRTRADQLARKDGITRAQWIILARLNKQPGVSQNELAALAEVTPMTIARLIDRLQEQGLVERSPDPLDRRVWRLRLTAKAKPHLKNLDRYRDQLRELVAKDIDPKALETVAQTLRIMKHNLAASPLILETELTDDSA